MSRELVLFVFFWVFWRLDRCRIEVVCSCETFVGESLFKKFSTCKVLSHFMISYRLIRILHYSIIFAKNLLENHNFAYVKRQRRKIFIMNEFDYADLTRASYFLTTTRIERCGVWRKEVAAKHFRFIYSRSHSGIPLLLPIDL